MEQGWLKIVNNKSENETPEKKPKKYKKTGSRVWLKQNRRVATGVAGSRDLSSMEKRKVKKEKKKGCGSRSRLDRSSMTATGSEAPWRSRQKAAVSATAWLREAFSDRVLAFSDNELHGK